MVDNEIKCRLFVDIDGTLNYFKAVDTIDALYMKGYFKNLEPMNQVVKGLQEFIKHDKEVYILTNVLDSKYALEEKNQWLDKFLPEIDNEHRIFVPFGENVFDYIPGEITKTDFLLDDFVDNLKSWEKKGTGIKLVNNINDRNASWEGEELYYNKESLAIAYTLKSIQNRSVLNELMYNRDFFIDEDKKIERKDDRSNLSIADRIKSAKEKASKQIRDKKDISRNGHQR